jgi:hypothetical protein
MDTVEWRLYCTGKTLLQGEVDMSEGAKKTNRFFLSLMVAILAAALGMTFPASLAPVGKPEIVPVVVFQVMAPASIILAVLLGLLLWYMSRRWIVMAMIPAAFGVAMSVQILS